jgi:hypothetical protein
MAFVAAAVVAATGIAAGQPADRERPLTIDRTIESAPLSVVARKLKERHGLTLVVEEGAFRKAGVKDVADKPVRARRLAQVPPALVAELVAQQVGGIARHKGERTFVLVPGERPLVSVLQVPTDQLKKKLGQNVTFERPVRNAPLHDIAEYLEDKYEVMIVVDEASFPAAGRKDVEFTQCNMPAGTKTLTAWLTQLADQVGGVAVSGENHIIVIAAAPPKKP